MWEKPTVYAVRKKGNVRAKLLLESETEANEVAANLGKDYEVEVRPGERTRCANFCPVAQFCDQYQSYLQEQQSE